MKHSRFSKEHITGIFGGARREWTRCHAGLCYKEVTHSAENCHRHFLQVAQWEDLRNLL